MDAPALWQNVTTNNTDPRGHVQTESDHWLASDFNGRPNPNLRSHDCPRSPIQLPGGNDKSRFDSGYYLPIPTIPQPLGAFSQNSEAFGPAGYTGLFGLTGPVHPSENTQGLRAGHHVFRHGPRQGNTPPPLLPTGSRVSDTASSGYPLPNEAPSRSGLQESGPLPAIQSVARSEVVPSGSGSFPNNGGAFVIEGTTLNLISPPSTQVPTPTVDEPLNRDPRAGVIGMPNWVALTKTLSVRAGDVITLRRDSHFALELILAHLPMGSLEVCDGIKIPATTSVKNLADTTGKTLLEFRIRLHGANTKTLYEFICETCQKREGKRRGTPSLVDFKAEYDIIEPKDGIIRVEFSFCCYPRCRKLGDTEYLLDIVLSEDEGQDCIVAQCRLPFYFNILSKLPPGQRPPTKRPRPEPHPRQVYERPPTLTEVNPDSGSTTGGVRIWLRGMDFPALLPLFARFGAAVVPTTFSSSNLLACHLPPMNNPGVIHVTLSKYPQLNAPGYGTSIAMFKYKGDHEELISILLRIRGQANSPLLQAILTALNDQVNSAPGRSAYTFGPIQPQPEYHVTNDFHPTLGTARGIGLPMQQHGGITLSGFDPTWSLPTNIPDPLAHRPQYFQFGARPTPSMNQGPSPSVPLNPATGNFEYSSFNAPSLPRKNLHSDNSIGLDQQTQYPQVAGNNQNTVPFYGAQVMGGGHGISDRPFGTHGASAQSSREHIRLPARLFSHRHAAYDADTSVMGGTGAPSNQAIQEQNNAIISAPVVEPIGPILAPIAARGRSFILRSITPRDPPTRRVACSLSDRTVRNLVPPQSSYRTMWNNAYPETTEENARRDITGDKLVHNPSSTRRERSVSEGSSVQSTPGRRLYRTQSGSQVQSSSQVRTGFDRTTSDRINIRENSTPTGEDGGVFSSLRNCSRGHTSPSEVALNNAYSQTTEEKARNDTKGYKPVYGPSIDSFTSREGSVAEGSSVHNPPGLRHRRSHSSSHVHSSSHARTGLDRTTSDRINIRAKSTPTGEVGPLQQRSVWSKVRSAIAKGFSRIGLSAPTIVRTPRGTSSGGLGSARKRGHTQTTGGPAWHFESPFVAPLQDSLRAPVPPTTFDGTHGSQALRGRNHNSSRRRISIETGVMEALCSLQLQPNFRGIVSTTNDWGQTLAHLSICYDYPYLLRSLVDWRIDLAIADANGLTALHYAYMKGDLDSVRILRRGGASERVVDKLGRTPLDLRPEGFGSVFDLDNDARATVGFDSEASSLESDSDEEVY